ncbi:MAG: hypothetical protein ACLUE8_03985 [Lachnospiraceae bacterium]
MPSHSPRVYVTSPDYLGGMADVSGLWRRSVTGIVRCWLVDNAHGAYLRFLEPSCHPLDLGADLCCDSAHKTLPVLTGGAYLHLQPCELRRSSCGESAETALATVRLHQSVLP